MAPTLHGVVAGCASPPAIATEILAVWPPARDLSAVPGEALAGLPARHSAIARRAACAHVPDRAVWRATRGDRGRMTPGLSAARYPTARHAASWASPRADVTDVLAVWPPSRASRGRRSAIARHAIARHAIARHAIARHAIARHAIARHAIARHAIARHAIEVGVGLPNRAVPRATVTEVLAV
ncbi:hypothetical protein AB0J72_35440 [Dactylosporangium sp. NPDC049742]|uniref:hypothetical protein n=1 Tax=Dactylosporangium sp. NPDC049742 TaxID=3154737 RepID=UPI003441EE01